MPVYGDGTKYGNDPVYGGDSLGLRFVLEVDWHCDGSFSTTSEFEELKSFSVERGRKYLK